MQNFDIFLQGALLGIIQGLTEFLPISSSGHLALAMSVFNLELPLSFDILLHIATLFAVGIYSYPLIINIVQATIRQCFSRKVYLQDNGSVILKNDQEQMKILVALIISTLATAPIAIFLKDLVENPSKTLIASSLLITALLLSLPFIIPKTRKKIQVSIEEAKHKEYDSLNVFKHLSWKYIVFIALLVGLVQGMAVIPGISRSGSTISFAVLFGLSYARAIRYSFLMSIPAILASFVFSISDLDNLMKNISYGALTISMLLAFVFGLLGLYFLSFISKQGKIWYFSFYLLIVGVLTFIV